MENLCEPCKSRGRLAPGVHVVVDKPTGKVMRKCNECKAARISAVGVPLAPIGRDHPEAHIPNGQTAEKREHPRVPGAFKAAEDAAHTVARNAATKGQDDMKNIDWEAVQRDRNAGMTTTALGEKYGCSSPTICAHTHRRGIDSPTRPAAGKSKAPKAARAARSNGAAAAGLHRETLLDRAKAELAYHERMIATTKEVIALLEGD